MPALEEPQIRYKLLCISSNYLFSRGFLKRAGSIPIATLFPSDLRCLTNPVRSLKRPLARAVFFVHQEFETHRAVDSLSTAFLQASSCSSAGHTSAIQVHRTLSPKCFGHSLGICPPTAPRYLLGLFRAVEVSVHAERSGAGCVHVRRKSNF